MSVASTAKRVMEVTLYRSGVDSQTFTLPEGATLADLLREAGGEMEARNIQINGRPLEDFVILSSGMTVTVLPEPIGSRQRTWKDTIGMFADDPTFEEAVAAGRAYREADRKATLEEMDRDDS